MPQTSLLAFLQPVSTTFEDASNLTGNPVCASKQCLRISASQQEPKSLSSISEKKSILDQILPESHDRTRVDFAIPQQCPDTIICKVQSHHLQQIKQLTGTLLPVRYPDKFFDLCIEDALLAEISQVVLHNSKPVGWIRCRLEPRQDGTNDLYIQVIGVLAPWRGLGLAVGLLDRVTRPEIILQHQVFQVYAHVWQNSEDALEWYEKRGFTRARLEPNYYRRLRPAGAWVLQKGTGYS